MYHKEFPVLSSLFLLLINNKKTIDELEDNIHAYFYFDEKTNNCKNHLKYGEFLGVSSFIDDLCGFSSCKAIFQYEINTKFYEFTMKSNRIVSYDNYENSFSSYLEKSYTDKITKRNIKGR
jgi:hypothetical protein